MKIKLIRDYYNEKEYLYDRTSIDLKPGFTVLVGCNGSGKSTMIRQIKHYCEENDIPVFLYDNYKNDNASNWDKWLNDGNIDFLTTSIVSSEGERIMINLNDIASQLGKFVQKNKGHKELVILFDAIDSGFSIDNVIDFKESLIEFIIDDCERDGVTLYIVAASNAYELARGEQCLNVQTCKYVTIKTYERYRNIVLITKEKKDARYK